MVDVVLAATFGRLGDGLLCLALGADKQHPASSGNDITNPLQRMPQHWYRLLEINDVNIVALTEDVGFHLRIPASCLMSEVNTGF